MQTLAIWSNEFGNVLALSKKQEDKLKDICDVMELFAEHNVKMEISDDAYTNEFSAYLWNNKTLKSRSGDDLILLRKSISRAKRVATNTYKNDVETVRQKGRREALLLMLDTDLNNELCIESEDDYYVARSYQMKYLVYENEFYDLAKFSYKNLLIGDAVKESINHLNNPFDTMRELIGEHLSMLDYEYKLLFDNQKRGYVELASMFEDATGIECSTQASRENVKALYFDFMDANGHNSTVLCELHTKLKFKGMDYKKQDRIYFHPPIDNIADGRILIAYIGKHL